MQPIISFIIKLKDVLFPDNEKRSKRIKNKRIKYLDELFHDINALLKTISHTFWRILSVVLIAGAAYWFIFSLLHSP